MPTIRISEKTWDDLNRVAKEFVDLKRLGYENILKISPDKVIKQLVEDWDYTEKEDIVDFEKRHQSVKGSDGKMRRIPLDKQEKDKK